MLSKFKKLFRVSRSLAPLKEKEGLQVPQNETPEKTTKKKEKGKRKVSSSQQQDDIGDVVEAQNQCSASEEVEIVANEFEEQNHDADEYPFQ